jgi:hypothetical protein
MRLITPSLVLKPVRESYSSLTIAAAMATSETAPSMLISCDSILSSPRCVKSGRRNARTVYTTLIADDSGLAENSR